MKITKNDNPIIIVGAGIGGLTLALALIRKGNAVQVYEQAQELGEVGAGLSLAPNCSKVFNALGIIDQFREASNVPVEGEIRNGVTGEWLSTTPFVELQSTFGYPYYQIHRADAHKMLVDAVLELQPDCIHLSHTFSNYQHTDTGVSVEFSDQSPVQGACLIGCDGIKSAVRERMLGKDNPRFTGFVAWRAIVPADKVDPQYSKEYSRVRAGDQRQIVYYPIRRGKAVNVAIFAEQDWRTESWTVKADKNEIKQVFSDYQQETLKLIDAIDDDTCFKWALFDRDPIPCWQDRSVVLLGDAAHPMLPFLGQGAAMAIEDAWFLSEAIENGKDLETAFGQYQDARLERSSWVLEESRKTGKRMGAKSAKPENFSNDRAMFTEKIFGYDPITATEIAYSQ